jgi:N-acetylmuramoyl-L-alanine amidase CwlA
MLVDEQDWAAERLTEHRDWRGWSFREWRLDRYLANTARPMPPP